MTHRPNTPISRSAKTFENTRTKTMLDNRQAPPHQTKLIEISC